MRKLPNSSTHAVIKKVGLIFTELGRPFILRSDNRLCYTSREFHNFLSFYQVDHITSSPHYPQSNGFAEALVGVTKKLMEKSVKDGKLWNYGLMQYRTTPISSTLPITIRDVDRKKTLFHPSTTFHQLLAKMWKPPRSMRNCLGGSPTLPQGPTWNWTLDNPVFVKEVNGNVWKTATVDQPAAEPDSYWVRFPDNSILRRTRAMIKPRSQPSHFELQAEAQPWNFERTYCSHSSDSLQSDECRVNAACYTNGECDTTSNQR